MIGDSQVRFDQVHALALEIEDRAGHVGLGFGHTLFDPYPSLAVLEATFSRHVWPGLDGQDPQVLIHRIERPRGGHQRDAFHGFGEALQIALWDLAAQQAGLPLSTYLGGTRPTVAAYASGLDFHMTDSEFMTFFAEAASAGFRAFKIKVGHRDPHRDLHRLELLRQVVGSDVQVMIDANEAWTVEEAAQRLTLFRDSGFPILWAEDPILRDDFDGLRALRAMVPWVQVNSGEYLDISGRRRLLQAGGTDILNVHGRITEVMRIGWLAADMGVGVSLGNTFLETGVHAACALPEVRWMEYSFQNYDHLVDEPILIRDGHAHVGRRPGIGFALSSAAREAWSAPEVLETEELAIGPVCAVLQRHRQAPTPMSDSHTAARI
ncbi:mandelate racemase/muconate lactonizing enzyme family protein [Rubellimicrobium arenae]|uniref:mandelate racemase/muconate lactonizing enzyme family protein n=2 Tax=Rubellimicrobium arenae TaxID=2817372 RepID=UPI001B30F1CB